MERPIIASGQEGSLPPLPPKYQVQEEPTWANAVTAPMAENNVSATVSETYAPRHSSVSEQQPNWIKTRKGIAAATFGVVALGGGAGAVGYNSLSNSSDSQEGSASAATVEVNDQKVVVCPEGMYPRGPLESSSKAFGDDLNERPDSNLDTSLHAVNYLFGGPEGDKVRGVACENAPTLAAFTAVYNDLLGSGSGGRGFRSTNIPELQAQFAADPAASKQAADILAKAWGRSEDNKDPIEGPMFRFAGKHTKVVGPDGAIVLQNTEVELVPESVKFPAGSVLVLEWNKIIGDSDPSNANQSQVVVLEKSTGRLYVLKAVGAPIRQPEESLPAQIPVPEPQPQPEAQEEQPNNGGGGGGGGGSGRQGGGKGKSGGGGGNGGGNGGGSGGGSGGGCGGSCGQGGGGGNGGGGGGNGGGGGGNGGGGGGNGGGGGKGAEKPPVAGAEG